MSHTRVLVLLAAVAYPAVADEPLPAGAIGRLGDPRFRAGGAAFALSPDGARVAVADSPTRVRILDAESWREQRRLELPPVPTEPGRPGRMGNERWNPPEALQFDSSGGRLAARVRATLSSYLVRWNVETGKVERTDLLAATDARHLAVTPDLRRVVMFGPDPARKGMVAAYGVIVRDLESGETTVPITRLTSGELEAVIVSADGARAVGVSREERLPMGPPGGRPDPKVETFEVPVWDLTTGKELARIKLSDPMKAAAFSPDGTRLVVQYGSYGERGVWDLGAGKWLMRFAPREGSGPTFFLGNDAVGTVSRGGVYQRRDVATGRLTDFVDGPEGESDPTTVAVAPRADGSIRFCGRSGPTFVIWDVAAGGGKPARVFGSISGPTRPLAGLAFTADGKTLRALCEEGRVWDWSVTARRVDRQFRIGPPTTEYSGPRRHSPRLSADGHLAFFSDDNRTRVWDLDRGLDVATVGSKRALGTVAPDGRVVDGAPDPARLLRRAEAAGDGPVIGSAVSTDGRLGVVAYLMPRERSRNRLFVVGDLTSGKTLTEIRADESFGSGFQLGFSRGGNLLVHSDEWIASAWDWRTGRLLSTSRARPPVLPAVSPDDRLVARSATPPYQVRPGVEVVERVTGGVRLSFPVSGPGPAAFARDGKTLAAPAPDGTILLWDVTRPVGAPEPKKWTAAEADGLWTGLGDPDAARGFVPLARLLAFPDDAVALLKERLTATDAAADIARQIRRLDADALAEREAATRELAQFGDRAVEALRKALAADPSAEARRRLEFLSDDLAAETRAAEIRPTRAVEVLERIGTPAARTLLETLAKGPADDVLAREAKAAIGRMAK